MNTNCKICGSPKNSVGYPSDSKHEQCEPCRLTEYFKQKGLFNIESFECVDCKQIKKMDEVCDIVKYLNGGLKYRCRECSKTKITNEKESADGYIKIFHGRVRNNIRKLNKRLGPIIKYNLLPDIIINKFKEQTGVCSISGEKMTHVVCESKKMLTTHPNNMIVELIDITKGYVSDNIRLICCKFYNEISSPGLIMKKNFDEKVSVYRPIRNDSKYLYHPYQVSRDYLIGSSYPKNESAEEEFVSQWNALVQNESKLDQTIIPYTPNVSNLEQAIIPYIPNVNYSVQQSEFGMIRYPICLNHCNCDQILAVGSVQEIVTDSFSI